MFLYIYLNKKKIMNNHSIYPNYVYTWTSGNMNRERIGREQCFIKRTKTLNWFPKKMTQIASSSFYFWCGNISMALGDIFKLETDFSRTSLYFSIRNFQLVLLRILSFSSRFYYWIKKVFMTVLIARAKGGSEIDVTKTGQQEGRAL